MHRERHLFPRLIDFGHLHRAFLGASAGKRDRVAVQRFEHDLERRLLRMRRDLVDGTYRWGAHRCFLIRDPKHREIRAAPFRDRVLHHALVALLDPLFTRGYIADTYACIRGRGVHAAVRRYRSFVRAQGGQGHRLQCDIARYFASVDHAVLIERLTRRIADERVLDLLRSLVAHGADEPGRGMPIGNLTSQMFANLYLDPLDHFVKETLRVRHYLRYMDDFVLLAASRAEARALRTEVDGFVRERLRLRLNPRRVVLAPLATPCDLLGYLHGADGTSRVRRRSARRLWARLPILARRVESNELAWPAARSSVASWLGLTKHADAFQLSRAIFMARDVRNVGKRLLVCGLSAGDNFPLRTVHLAADPS